MIYTSYFGKLKKLPENIIPIAICAKIPDWYTGLSYKKLAPKYEFFNKWKHDHDNGEYVRCYKEQVLDKLNVDNVVKELDYMMLDETNSIDSKVDYVCHIALICYEKPSDFCHRHIVAEWLIENGYKCEEWNE